MRGVRVKLYEPEVRKRPRSRGGGGPEKRQKRTGVLEWRKRFHSLR